jgi:hypothetical protein
MRYRQRGVTFIGWLVLLLPVAIVGYVGIRTVPVYLNYMKVSRSLERLATENAGDEQKSAQAMRTSLNKQFDIDSISFPPIESIAFSRDGKSWVARAKYEDEVPLFANLSLLIKFDKSVSLK